MSEAIKRRDWCFTLNNYSEVDIQRVQQIECKYLVYGKEVGANGTPHLQGYIYFKNQRAFKGVKSLFPSTVHLEAAIACAEKNIQYCKKGEQPKAEWEHDGIKGLNYGLNADVFEKGDKPKTQKEKGDGEVERYEEAKRAAMDGKLEDIPGDIFIRCYNSLVRIKKDYMEKPKDLDDVCGVWIYGPAGIGKSRKAREDFPGSYDKMCNKWWDGYQGEQYAVIDDFGKDHNILGHHLKRWADRYSFIAENKGGAVNIRPKNIVVTSQYSIEQIWEDQETRDALNRRFKVIAMVEPYAPTFIPPLTQSQTLVPSTQSTQEDESMLSEEDLPSEESGDECEEEFRVNKRARAESFDFNDEIFSQTGLELDDLN